MARYPVTSVALAVAVALTGFAPQALAADDQKLSELEQRLEALEIELIEARDAAKKTDRVKFSKSSPAPTLVSKDGRSTLNFKARIQADYVDVDEMYEGKKLNYEPAHKDTNIRRLRLGIEGQFARLWEYEIELDFADSEVDLKDAKVTWEGWDDQKLTLGFQKYAFGLQGTQSSAHQIMMERASTDTFSPDRALGAQWRYAGNNWAMALGYGIDFSKLEEEKWDSDEQDFEEEVSYPETTIINARVTGTPIRSNDNLLHLGASYLMMDINDDIGELRYRARPASKPASRMIDTGNFDAKGAQHYGAEVLYQHRNLLLQGEYIAAKADAIDKPDVEVDAYYLTASYILTGEKWRYSRKKGVMKSPRPDKPVSAGGWGAWEVAVRYDQANFSDNSLKYGGDMTNYVVGLNWYLEDNLKAQLNYVYAEGEYDKSFDDINGIEQNDQDTSIIQARLQFAF
ncbi:OprO/OprP family phosphate-selective porin [Ferrimonas sp. SCSIO 43195]|uniref:OprO/OprP family phosphate-selective porin n=1 Tax=Ferrimonas sp. SCSIO 43195 TaxID=2822844 RepID=UPI0020756A6E|nr:porin [Ferrimonas sp. SCSIO 43195]USD37398.1 carbohydrate porin [Ferrimonas sp. SCSIO 43195]